MPSRSPARGVLFDRTFPARPQSVGTARSQAIGELQLAGLAPAVIQSVKLAISEAATNAVVHGQPAAVGEGSFRVRVEVDARGVEVTVEDAGAGIVARPEQPGLGLGLTVIDTLAQDVDFGRSDLGGTRIAMRFDLGA